MVLRYLDISLPNPLPLNPNSIENVRKVLDHIQEINGINKGEKKWISIVCDGVSYNYAQKNQGRLSENSHNSWSTS